MRKKQVTLKDVYWIREAEIKRSHVLRDLIFFVPKVSFWYQSICICFYPISS